MSTGQMARGMSFSGHLNDYRCFFVEPGGYVSSASISSIYAWDML